jgi:type I restriction enzyme S subunit
MSDEPWATPPSWVWTTLDDVASWSSGGTPKSSEPRYYGGEIPWLIIGDLNDDMVTSSAKSITPLGLENSSAKYVEPGAVMIALYGSIGKLGIAGMRCTTNQAIAFTKATSAAVHQRFLFRYLQSIRGRLLEMGKGVGQPNISQTILKAFPICIAPLEEQRRIVAKLETLLGKVDACQRRLAKIPRLLKRFRQSVLAAACSGRLTADWREQNPQVEDATQLIAKVRAPRAARFQDAGVRDDLDFAELPETWAWTNLRFLLSPSEAFCYGVVQPGENDPDGAFLIRAGDLDAGRVNTSSLRRIPLSVHHDYRRAQLAGGEILVTVVGAGIGETVIAQPECAGYNIARAVAKLPVREFSARYVHLWLSTSRALHWMKGDSREVARPTLNLEQLQTLPVPLPPLTEQDEIVRRVEQLFTFADQVEARFGKAQAHVDKLTQSLLAKAFRGELVPQDPNDEPASALLARMRSESNGGEKLSRRKTRA